MTPDQQRIAIAGACGTMQWSYALPTKCIGASVPDYLNDLNACYEMEELLDEGQKERFVFWINHLHPFADIHYSERKRATRLEVFSLVHATAAQRAVAFLHTLGLWQETPTQPQ
jgi:hypothetical protein